ncbi:hypothetical protein GALL_495490 [mine drainage metagenome]|uniref:Uncharacterized protein n=1 Tax=mine drainage metagenome TaxID=410659 RepID=A0A1J5PMN1_9ZZZZ
MATINIEMMTITQVIASSNRDNNPRCCQKRIENLIIKPLFVRYLQLVRHYRKVKTMRNPFPLLLT